MQLDERALRRFNEKCQVDPESGCWRWTGYVRPDGYAQFGFDGRTLRAHRVSYVIHVGPIPEGLVVDHLCRVRDCVNPLHLRACSQRQNVHAPGSLCLAAINARRVLCERGHLIDGRQLRSDGSTQRVCRACHREARRRYERRVAGR